MDCLKLKSIAPVKRARVQTANHVLMIRPVKFLSNPQTTGSNAFQCNDLTPEQAQVAACAEFDRYAELLREADVGVLVIEDVPEPHTPDSIFPNNWVSFGADGRIFLYPMEAPNRRMERRPAILEEIKKHFAVRDLIDLSSLEREGKFLEGTGSMVMDHVARIAYLGHSSRSHPDAIRTFERLSGYRAVHFHARDRQRHPIYHTNVMMSVGTRLAIVCLEAISQVDERNALRQSLEASGKKIVAISLEQVGHFAGNIIELRSRSGQPLMAMSRRAWSALERPQKEEILRHAKPILAPIETIERLGGGSARCMVAEIFLPNLAGLGSWGGPAL
jgi:hypothetical protein